MCPLPYVPSALCCPLLLYALCSMPSALCPLHLVQPDLIIVLVVELVFMKAEIGIG